MRKSSRKNFFAIIETAQFIYIRNRWTRLLAMILAVAMVLSSQSVTALATQVGIVVNNGTNETETPDETQTADETDSGTNSLPSPDQSAETTVNKPGIITAETSVNLREEPGTDSIVVTQLENGTSVTVVSQISVSGAAPKNKYWNFQLFSRDTFAAALFH